MINNCTQSGLLRKCWICWSSNAPAGIWWFFKRLDRIDWIGLYIHRCHNWQASGKKAYLQSGVGMLLNNTGRALDRRLCRWKTSSHFCGMLNCKPCTASNLKPLLLLRAAMLEWIEAKMHIAAVKYATMPQTLHRFREFCMSLEFHTVSWGPILALLRSQDTCTTGLDNNSGGCNKIELACKALHIYT